MTQAERGASENSRPPARRGGAGPFVNRELSWLDFNERVLELAEDDALPLLERLKFLAIYATNLDEFFMVRVAGLHDQVDAEIDARGPDGLSPSETIDLIARRSAELGARHARALADDVGPALREHGIRVVDCADCDRDQLGALEKRFREQIFPVLTPLAVGPGRPFPYVSNLSLSLGVQLRDPREDSELFARVKVPTEMLPRFLEIEEGVWVPLESVIARHLDQLFPGMEIVRHAAFRVTRDADFTVSDEADDLLRAVEDELRRRRFGEVVRLEVEDRMDSDMRAQLVEWLELEQRQVHAVDGLLALGDLWQLHDLPGHAELRDPPWTPVAPGALAGEENGEVDVFERLRAGDLLVHHPYDSFAASVERFVEQAVEDPDVLAVKLTVYRTSDDSGFVPALIDAAERGKQAVCMVELKARFDERRNIEWARALEEAGAHVVRGLPGLKTHAKALLVVRREGEGGAVRHYVHVGTGNYHAKTARLYEDLGLFTADPEVGADLADLFNSLTGHARPGGYRKVIVAPAHLRPWLGDQIDRTIAAHEAGEDTRIVMKMNALVDPQAIEAIYRASRAGISVDLLVRGVCCLVPGVEGLSENVRVRSVVGRFLEHSRVFSFIRGDERALYIGSADLMPRNLDNRVELLVPVESPPLREQVGDVLARGLADDTFAWELGPDGAWSRRRGGERSLHAELMEIAHERAASEAGGARTG